jgi:DHA1 family tetracycline resistance protein-like MFS transporter
VVRKLAPILGITFVDILGFSILIPILPFYVTHFHVSERMVGWLFATFAFCSFVAAPLWGNISDRIGRKTVLIISQIGATIGWAMLAFAPSLGWVFAARVVEGISGGNISVTQAYVADRVEPEQRSRAFAYVGAAFSAGFIFGPIIGGVLLQYGYKAPFLLAAGLQVITLIMTIFWLPEDIASKAEAGPSASFKDIFRFLGDPGISPILIQKLAFSLALYGWFAVYALMLQALIGFGPSQTSFFFAAFGVVSVIFQLGFVGRISDRLGLKTRTHAADPRLGHRRASNVGFVAACAFFLIVPLATHIWSLALIMALFSFALSITNAMLPALLTDASPERVRGTVLGVGSSLESISGVITPPLTTAVLASYGPAWTAAIPAFFCFIALALGIVAQRREGMATPPKETA